MMNLINQRIKELIISLLINGFYIDYVNRISKQNTIINIYRYDKLGQKIKYSLLLSLENSKKDYVDNLEIISKDFNSKPIIVSDLLKSNEIDSYKYHEFGDIIGGITNLGLVLNPLLTEILDDLGKGIVPAGMEGNADDLFELYVKECLNYLLYSPTRRFGSDRRFESLPDIIVLGKNRTNILVDAKSYSNGFSFSSDDIERFEKYINDYNDKYSTYFGRVYSFLVVTSKFNDSMNSIESRSETLYSKTQTKLVCIDSRNLSEMINLIKEHTDYRDTINWKIIFNHLMIKSSILRKYLNKLIKDNII